ncbi:NAD-dependent epimerase/dehydratase family protein [Sphingobacterium sp. Ag1]|uniref:NAD-dependent epimerase/dehydratase family protein n=1 Tax=Sphingobacterium sp. Ag1 TaxID=1643451 RepID=UPI0018CDF210|nr:NAD(P)-dependent oxidoreductase [Sphingobacterium sp. Ag1]
MRILVTGSSGKLGSITVRNLRRAGHNVTGIDLLASDTTEHFLDIQQTEAVVEFTRSYDAIVHTAALHGRHMDLNYSRQSFIDTNITGTLNLLNACVTNGVKRFLFTSTTSIYGKALVDSEKAVWVTEELTIQPRDIYDITKQACEELCRDFFEKEQLMTSVYRVGRFLPEPDNLMLNHRLYRGLDQRDGAEALRLGIETDFTSFQIFNISSGSPFEIEDLIELKFNPLNVIATRVPKAIEIYRQKGWSFPASIDRVYRSDKAMQLLGYKPKYTFEFLLDQLP